MEAESLISLRDPAREINREHGLAAASDANSIKHKIRCGKLLAQKKAIKHSNFMGWVKANCKFGHDTAMDYMNVFRNQNRTTPHLKFRQLRRNAKPAAVEKPREIAVTAVVPCQGANVADELVQA